MTRATDIPIIFSGPMVRALLEGRKTMTRRIIKLPTKGQYVRPDIGGWAPTTVGGGASFAVRRDGRREPVPELVAIWNQTTGTCLAARYQIGDRLWVRENFAHVGTCDPGFLTYQATYPDDLAHLGMEIVPATLKEAGYKWKASIHMPRPLSRLTLIVGSAKVERLQDISHDDAVQEGASDDGGPGTTLGFINIWKKLHGAASWEQNPFVVAISFRVIKANIDAPEARVAA